MLGKVTMRTQYYLGVYYEKRASSPCPHLSITQNISKMIKMLGKGGQEYGQL